MDIVTSLDEYERLLAPARERFAVSPGVQATPRPLRAVSLPDGEPLVGGQRKAAGVDNGTMNLHLADGGYYDNSGVTALVQWLHNGLSDLADGDPARLPKEILVIRINAFPAAEQGCVKEHRGTFFQFWAPLLAMNTFRGAAHACSMLIKSWNYLPSGGAARC
jgi:hypothetical protein